MAPRTVPLLVASTLALAMASCSNRTDPADGTGAPAADERLLAFVECMRAEGVALADPVVDGDRVEIGPGPGGTPPDRDEFEAAEAACAEQGLTPFTDPAERPDPAAGADRADRALAFARCARASGVTLPDPVFEGDSIANWDVDELGIDLDDPEIVEIGDRCAEESQFDPNVEG